MKLMIHDQCGGLVSKKTLICDICKSKPNGNNITLERKKYSFRRGRGMFDDPEFYFSPHNRRNQTNFGYPRA